MWNVDCIVTHETDKKTFNDLLKMLLHKNVNKLVVCKTHVGKPPC